jgi:hypothetical protein
MTKPKRLALTQNYFESYHQLSLKGLDQYFIYMTWIGWMIISLPSNHRQDQN